MSRILKALRLKNSVDPAYIAWVFEGVGKGILGSVVEEAAHGTRVIRMDQWRAVIMPVPPIAEQITITTFLDRETTRLDALAGQIRRAIDRLKELRIALISAAVTGRIDVRAAAREGVAREYLCGSNHNSPWRPQPDGARL